MSGDVVEIRYGRSRLMELVFGGVTKYMLGHADLPVLIAH